MKDLLKTIYKAMDDKQAEELVVIDFKEFSPFVDYFIIGSASNQRKAKAIAENIVDVAEINNIKVKSFRYNNDSKWLLIDLEEIVCHIFVGDERQVYNLEGLWKDLPRITM